MISITTTNPPITDAIMPNMEGPPILAIAPIATAAMMHMIPEINSRTARIVMPVGLDVVKELRLGCSVGIGFPHFVQKLLPITISVPQCLQNVTDSTCSAYR